MRIITCPNCGAKNRVDERRRNQKPRCGRCGAPLQVATEAFDSPLVLNDDTLQRTLDTAGDKPLLVDFWASWCPPCRMLAPTIEALAKESAGRWIVAKLDTDANPQTPGRLRIEALPTMIIFKRGQAVETLVGLQPRHAIQAALEKHV